MTLTFDHPQLERLCRRCGVVRLEVFGPVARSEDGMDSDIDLLHTLVLRGEFGTRDRVLR